MGNKLKCCPRCKGDQGIEYRFTERRYCHLNFFGTQSCDVDKVMSEPKTGKCLDCGYRIKLTAINTL
jgi:hypothetical protein